MPDDGRLSSQENLHEHQRIHVRLDEVAQGQARTNAQIEEIGRNIGRTEEMIKDNAKAIANNARQISQTQGMNRDTNHKVEQTLSRLTDVSEIAKSARTIAENVDMNTRPVIQSHKETQEARAEGISALRKIIISVLIVGAIWLCGWLGRAAYVYFFLTEGGE